MSKWSVFVFEELESTLYSTLDTFVCHLSNRAKRLRNFQVTDERASDFIGEAPIDAQDQDWIVSLSKRHRIIPREGEYSKANLGKFEFLSLSRNMLCVFLIQFFFLAVFKVRFFFPGCRLAHILKAAFLDLSI